VPEDVKGEMQFILADQVDQVFTAALADKGQPGSSKSEEGGSDAHKAGS
jgi:hypothetical protein